jgi:hypothetical protein
MSELAIKQIRQKRESWVTLDEADGTKPAVRVRIIRPTEYEVSRDFSQANQRDPILNVRDYTVGWEGISEATYLGDGIGSDDPIDFDRDLWFELVSDRSHWVLPVMTAIVNAVNAHASLKTAEAKN